MAPPISLYSRIETRGTRRGRDGLGLHCLVPAHINSIRPSSREIPFVIPFVLQANSLISLLQAQSVCLSVCVCVFVYVCVCMPLCSRFHPSVKVSIDHYLGTGTIQTNGLHYPLINTDVWRWAIWQLIIRPLGACRGVRARSYSGRIVGRMEVDGWMGPYYDVNAEIPCHKPIDDTF